MNARHHHSHKNLLTSVEAGEAPQAGLDAIIVPNGRPAAYLKEAIGAAGRNNAHLLLLCSIRADASSAALEAKRAGVRVTAVDTDLLPGWLVPTFATDKLLRGGDFHRRVDTSLKRNLGLLIALLAGWERILFLDDDIVLPDPGDLTAAAGLLGEHPVVGLRNAGMPDNSVVCHALRDAGAPQDTFIGGGALAVGEAAFGSFFPNIYNEDWFFLLDGRRLRPTAVTGTAMQRPYDPYRDPRRARGEEARRHPGRGCLRLAGQRLRPGRRPRGVLAGVPARPAAGHQLHHRPGPGLRHRTGAEGQDGRLAQGGDRPQLPDHARPVREVPACLAGGSGAVALPRQRASP
ncbi:hypothetical protein [Amycolatopsis nalaikhensis]|uniref:Uncharacterized protein n=1 Tax=Amycolatopsis nalaikhensis TaxID=715472 RepID=A0ABY8XDP6_9PSEU|nr:hypothetical protein [Amycolatopsis sp. 2-2]WIV53042.1 hypothetical protein QP939_29435 [Amycolatopsis sp. 2-2]